MNPKFKGWDTKRNKMYSASELGIDELTINPDGRGFVNVSSTDQKLSQYMQHIIPLQFTGLKDKNNTEIYKGDVLQSNDMSIHVVEYNICRWSARLIRRRMERWPAQFLDCDYMGWIVIGNIYENPELIKGV